MVVTLCPSSILKLSKCTYASVCSFIVIVYIYKKNYTIFFLFKFNLAVYLFIHFYSGFIYLFYYIFFICGVKISALMHAILIFSV